jgi:hypothetical protein
MIGKGLVADGRNADGNRPPRTIGSSASPLMKRIDGSHKDLKLTAREERMIWMWIESGAPFAGTYAALGLPSAGVYRPDESVFARRCAGCHADGVPNAAQSVSASRPELSAMLLAPLAQAAGGWGRCRGEMRVGPVPGPRAAAPAPSPPPRPKPSMPRPGDRLDAGTDGVLDGLLDTLDAAPKRTPGPTSPTLATMPPPVEEPKPLTRHVETVFTDTTDPDYQKILAGIAATKDAILATQFESPAFVPPEDYVREMKRFGILPPSFDRLRDRTDVYALDQAYWRALQWPQICANP